MKKITLLPIFLLLGACSSHQVKTNDAAIRSHFVSPVATATKFKQQLISIKEPKKRHKSVLLQSDNVFGHKEGVAPFWSEKKSTKSGLPRFRQYIKRGVASWYGPGFHGRKTANGERFNMYKLTAAHRTLPIPSYARVTNLKNNRSIIVRINDRGPYSHNRILDLSYAAAKAIGINGTGSVEIKAVTSENLADNTSTSPES